MPSIRRDFYVMKTNEVSKLHSSQTPLFLPLVPYFSSSGCIFTFSEGHGVATCFAYHLGLEPKIFEIYLYLILMITHRFK
jgi:hypothetical protein